MTNITTTDAADFEEFTVRLTRIAGQDDLQLTLGDIGADLSVQITPDDLRTLAGWLTMQAAKLPHQPLPADPARLERLHDRLRYPVGVIQPETYMAPPPAPKEPGGIGSPRTWPDAECGDERASHGEALAPARCALQPGHTGNHRGGMYNWPPLQRVALKVCMHKDPGMRNVCGRTDEHNHEIPMGGRCGNVRYWREVNASKFDDDLRSVCTSPAGHHGSHEGPDQTGKTWRWLPGAECNATNLGNWCTLTCGHKGDHEQDGRTWQNRLSID